MARLSTCGFELNSGNIEGGIFSATGALVSSPTHSPSLSMKSTTNGEVATAQLPAAGATVFGRLYLYIETAFSTEGLLVAARNASDPHNSFHATLDASNVLRLYYETGAGVFTQITGTFTLSLNQWYRIEFKFDTSPADGSEVLNLYVNGDLVIGSSSLTFTTVAKTIQYISMAIDNGGDGTITGTIYFDDLAFNDNTGTKQTGLPGEGFLAYLRPNGPGDADTGSPTRGGTDSGSIQGQLDEVTPNDATDYVVLPVNPSDFWVDCDDLPAANSALGGALKLADTITLVEVHARFTGAAAQTGNWFPQIMSQSAGTKISATAVSFGTTSWFTNTTNGTAACQLVQYVDPQTSGAWTPALINSMQISARTTDGNPDTWVSAIWAIVEYVPAPVHPGLLALQNIKRAALY